MTEIMIQCPMCAGNINPEQEKCNHCGEILKKKEEEMKEALKDCLACGEEIKAIAKKCKHCGEMVEEKEAQVEKSEFKDCPSCGEQIKSDAKKCKHCGDVIGGSNASRTQADAIRVKPDSLIFHNPVLSLCLGIASILLCGILGCFLATAAIVIGHKSLDALKLKPELGRSGQAIGGLACGYFGMFISQVVFVILLLNL